MTASRFETKAMEWALAQHSNNIKFIKLLAQEMAEENVHPTVDAWDDTSIENINLMDNLALVSNGTRGDVAIGKNSNSMKAQNGTNVEKESKNSKYESWLKGFLSATYGSDEPNNGCLKVSGEVMLYLPDIPLSMTYGKVETYFTKFAPISQLFIGANSDGNKFGMFSIGAEAAIRILSDMYHQISDQRQTLVEDEFNYLKRRRREFENDTEY